MHELTLSTCALKELNSLFTAVGLCPQTPLTSHLEGGAQPEVSFKPQTSGCAPPLQNRSAPLDCWTYSNPYTLDLVVDWFCKCLSKTCRIKEFRLNYTSFIMTSDLCYILSLDSVIKNSDGVSAFFRFFKLAGRIMLGPNDYF